MKWVAKLYRRTDVDDEHFFVVIPEQYWTKGLDEMNLDTVASAPVPKRTRFTKLPRWSSTNSRRKLVEALREQKEYWEMQMAGEITEEWNDADKLGGGGNIDKYERYKERVRACSVFLQHLQENPSSDDRRIFHGEKVEIEESGS